MGMELGIDLMGDHTNDIARQDEFQKDHDEDVADMSLGGKRYRERR
jgi:hypothetical protein